MLPVSLRDSLAQLLPGFGGGGASAGAGAAVFAKFASVPVAAKIAAATLAVGTAGTVAGIERTHVGRHHQRPPAQLAVIREPAAPLAHTAVAPAARPVALVVQKQAVAPELHQSGSGRGGSGEAEHSGSSGDGSSGSGDSSGSGSGETLSGSGTSGTSGSGDSGHSGDSGGSGDSGDSGHSSDPEPVDPNSGH